jgi:hypothetical protein
MPRTVTLGTLVTRCKQRADREGDSHISDSEWKALISEVYASEIYGVVADAGLPYFQSEQTISATGADSYAEPADHLSTIAIDRVLDASGRRDTMTELMAQEIDRWAGTTGDAHGWAHIDDQIFLYPNPSSGTYKHRYIAQPADLSSSADGTAVDLVNADGESALIWGVTVLAKSKSDEDVTLAMRMRDEARERMVMWAANRSLNSPRRRIVSDDALVGGIDPADWRWPR